MRASVYVWRNGGMRVAGTLTLKGKQIVPSPDTPLLREMAAGPIKVITRAGFEMVGPTPDPARYLSLLPRVYTGSALRVAVEAGLDEAITRTQDGKFATDGPCPAAGCGLHGAHAGPHVITVQGLTPEARRAAYLARLNARDAKRKAKLDKVAAEREAKRQRLERARDLEPHAAALRATAVVPETFTSLKEAQDWMRQHYPWVSFFEGTKKTDPATIRALVFSWHDLARKFPEVAQTIPTITSKGRFGKSIAAANQRFFLNAQTGELRSERALEFNPKYLQQHSIAGQPSILGASGRRLFENEWLGSPEPESFMSHEFGHMVDFHYRPRTARADVFGRLRIERVPTPAGTVISDWTRANRAGSPSRYGATDPDELFAESFAGWHMKSLGKQHRNSPSVDSMDLLLKQARTASGAVQEAVTRTEDGKFASQGPCPESGCGRDAGHEGAHRDRETLRPADYQPAPRFATVEEMEDWLKATYPDLKTGRFFRDAENYNPEAVGKIVSTFHDLAQRFPDVAAQIKELTVAGPWDDDLGWSLNAFAAAEYVPNGSVITFNPGFLDGERGDLEAKSTEARNRGWLAVAGAEAIMAHEFGHIVQEHYQQLHEDAVLPVVRPNGFGIVADTVRAWTGFMLVTQTAPSDYAKTNDKEMFAETFSAWHAFTSGNQSRVGSGGQTSRAVGRIDDLLRAIDGRHRGTSTWQFSTQVSDDQRTAALAQSDALTKSLGLPPTFSVNNWKELLHRHKAAKKGAA